MGGLRTLKRVKRNILFVTILTRLNLNTHRVLFLSLFLVETLVDGRLMAAIRIWLGQAYGCQTAAALGPELSVEFGGIPFHLPVALL